jgi:hypothetical protein
MLINLCFYNCPTSDALDLFLVDNFVKFIYFRSHYCRQSPDLPFLHSSLPSIISPQRWQQWRGKTVVVHLQMESSAVTLASRKMSLAHVLTPAVGLTPGNFKRSIFLLEQGCCLFPLLFYYAVSTVWVM